MVSESEIVRAAEAQAREILGNAKKKAQEMHRAANAYVDDLMKKTEDSIGASLQEIRQARQSFKASKKQQS